MQRLGSDVTPPRLLFPEATRIVPADEDRGNVQATATYNPLIAQNAPQLKAVTSILRLPPGSRPFVVFGPYVRLHNIYHQTNIDVNVDLVPERL